MAELELPSENRLAELRQRGVVPYSPASSRLVGIALTLFTLAILSSRVDFVYLRKQIFGSDFEFIKQAIPGFFSILLLLSAVYLLGAAFTGLAQTKFLFRFSLSRSRGTGRSQSLTLARVIALTAFGVLATSVSLGIAIKSLPALSYFLVVDHTFWYAKLGDRLIGSTVSLGAILLVAAVITWQLARSRFFKAYGMSREDVSKDESSKEGEVD